MPCRPLRARPSLSLSLSLSARCSPTQSIAKRSAGGNSQIDFSGILAGTLSAACGLVELKTLQTAQSALAPGRGTRNNRGGDDSDRESCPCTTSRLYRRCRPPRTSWTSSCRRRRGRRRRSCEENGRYRESGSSTWCELVLLASAPFQPFPCPPSAPCAARRPRPPLRVPQDLTLSLCSLFSLLSPSPEKSQVHPADFSRQARQRPGLLPEA